MVGIAEKLGKPVVNHNMIRPKSKLVFRCRLLFYQTDYARLLGVRRVILHKFRDT